MLPSAKPIELAELAAELGLEVEGDSRLLVSGVAALEKAGPSDLAFVRSARYGPLVARTNAGALILPPAIDPGPRPAIRSLNPALDFARIAERFAAVRRPSPGTSPRAHVAEDAVVDATAALDAGVVVGMGSRVGPRSLLYPNVILYADVVVGADCVIHSGAVLREGTIVGDRVVLQPGVVLGGDGFGYIGDEQGVPRRVPQLGRVVIEDDVEVGANTTIDRATFDETRIRRGCKIDNLVQIGHNCDVGENTIIVAQSGLSGSVRVGKGAVLMARVGVAGHLAVGEGAFCGARAGVISDVAPGAKVWGTPQLEGRRWHRSMVALARLPETLRRLRVVERALGIHVARAQGGPADGIAKAGVNDATKDATPGGSAAEEQGER